MVALGDGAGYTNQQGNQICLKSGSNPAVTLTKVTPTTIKGTSSAFLGNSQGDVLLDTITNGEFYSRHNHHTGVIQY